eukprot:gnl/TRDRNA2_/TRDRNA2_189260_c0_seq1.p1 gnl/TRDRNA2_/TRDRNA2_189260_c0~~gnl/TRDRNA2_/TRDRNA2_189260_c0_seq1.p1  ORF type:complete len:606 (+),score=99.49 gnl/TRDRNA2_/TRDRNA2_189260_c0_seq1:77-1894(+)
MDSRPSSSAGALAKFDAAFPKGLPPLTVSRMGGLYQGPVRPVSRAQSSGGFEPLSGTTSSSSAPKVKIVLMPKDKMRPIEETLRKRRVLQSSASAPMLMGDGDGSAVLEMMEKARKETAELGMSKPTTPLPASITSDPSANAWHAVITGTRQVDFPANIENENTEQFVAWYREREMKQRCTNICSAWDLSSTLPADEPRLASPSGTLGRSSPKRKGPPLKPLPPEMISKIQSSGWTVKRPSPWVEQARKLASKRVTMTSNVDAQRERSLHERLRLLHELETGSVPQGLEALRKGMNMRYNGIERAFKHLDVRNDGCANGLSLLELVGALAILGFDVPGLCGFGERELHRLLDADKDGRVRLDDFMREAPSGSGDGGGGPESSVKDKWVLLAKFIALSAWFYTPLALRKRERPGPDGARPPTGGGTISQEDPADGSVGVAAFAARQTAVGRGARDGLGDTGTLAKQQALDPIRKYWAPCEDDLEEVQAQVQAIFCEHATVRQFGEQLLSRSDVFRLFEDVPVAALCDEAAAAKVNRTEVGRIYDEALELQAGLTLLEGRSLTKGLTFASLRTVLHEVGLLMGLHFRHLVDDAVEASRDGYGMRGPR